MVRAMIMLWGGYRGFHQIMIGDSKAIFLLLAQPGELAAAQSRQDRDCLSSILQLSTGVSVMVAECQGCLPKILQSKLLPGV